MKPRVPGPVDLSHAASPEQAQQLVRAKPRTSRDGHRISRRIITPGFTLFLTIALACAGLFAGAAAYVTFVEDPARVSGGTAAAIAEFRPSYRRGSVMQASLAAIGLVASVIAWARSGDAWILVAGVLLGSAIPFRLLVILPINKRLIDPSLDPSSAEAATLIARWGRLHAVRTAAGLAAFVLLLARLAR